LKQLKADEAWLLSMHQGALPPAGATEAGAPTVEAQAGSPGGTAAAITGEAAAAQAVPQPRGAKKTGGTTRGQRKAAQAKPKEKAKPARKTAESKSGPPLRELVQGLLTGEPRTVGEVVKDLTQAHPERVVTSVQVVRNALETLVAKSLAERSKQGSTVYYTAPDNDTAAAAAPSATGESAAAETAEDSKVAAGV
ncbi:hypothetical protein ACFU5O_20210, partial [Streptomyces sp. NPDC057445]|uniref:hypothetical protein n=1 Tax=Streptomyces sp. NPDC057445 TaxID=3346136 RepID=UPI0036B45111